VNTISSTLSSKFDMFIIVNACYHICLTISIISSDHHTFSDHSGCFYKEFERNLGSSSSEEKVQAPQSSRRAAAVQRLFSQPGGFLNRLGCGCSTHIFGSCRSSQRPKLTAAMSTWAPPVDPKDVKVPPPADAAPVTIRDQDVPHVNDQPAYREPDGTFWMGPGTLRINLAMHKETRAKVCNYLKAGSWNGDGSTGEPVVAGEFMILKGGDELPKYDTDTNWNFRQESNFQYLFGVKEPGCFAAIDVVTEKSYLFVPQYPASYSVWMGKIKPLDWFKATYQVDEVHYVGQIAEILSNAGAQKLLWYNGANRDSGMSVPKPSFEGDSGFQFLNDQRMYWALQEARSVKTASELEILGFACHVSSLAHIACMQCTRPGQMEYVTEATFKYQSYIRGCSHQGYDNICGSGVRCTWLHYGHPAEANAEMIPRSAMRLCDMGSEYHVYTSDVTCSYPANGKFTDDQKTVYNAVWAAVLAVENAIRPGVPYTEIHRLAERTMLEKMTEAGLFVGNIDDMVRENLCNYFMPHGLGHLLGLDVHDVGGYEPGKDRIQQPGLSSLRCGRELKEGMVVTVEPGFYFNDWKRTELEEFPEKLALVNVEVLDRMWKVGGIRIEDDVLVMKDGCRVLNNVPRTVRENVYQKSRNSWQNCIVLHRK
jgi:Xaa-Pro dipeptidase